MDGQLPSGLIDTGRLKPSTRLTSKKSFPSAPARVYSARVTGGAPPLPLQGISPDPQSPVRQLNLPELDEHWDLAQNLPDHGAPMLIVVEACGANSKPVVGVAPVPVNVAGQIV